MKSFYVHNFGCRAAQADGAALETLLALRGLDAAPVRDAADLVVLNTCTVTAAADDDVRKTARRVNRENPGASILITGCYAQRDPEALADLPGVRWVVGNSHKTQIPDIIAEHAAAAGALTPYHGNIHVGDIFAQHEFLSAPVEDSSGDRTRPNLKIQDGCNNRCTFCVIPSVRGRSRSAPLHEVVEQVRQLAAKYREVVLSGINLGRWGRDNGISMRLHDLVRTLLTETSVARLRLSSVEPMDFSNELLELMASEPRIAPHWHAPLQSGSDSVLKRMKRRYRVRHYEDRMQRAYALLPEAAFGADVMVGFPGETDAEFEETRAFIERMPYTYLHVFTYSERPGTPAQDLADHVPMPVRKQRNAVLRELGAAKNMEFRRGLTGKRLSVVTLENERFGLSGNYVKVELHKPYPANEIHEIEIGGVTETGLAESRACAAPESAFIVL